jgi:sarcosine oxidase delta subunit
MKDLFNCLEEQPQELQNLFSEIEELSYKECESLLKQVEKLGYTFDYGLDSQPYNLRKKQTKREKILEQIELMETIQATAKINIVNCGNCGDVFLHKIFSIEEDINIVCPYCDFISEPCDFPDFLYRGLEDNLKFEITEEEKENFIDYVFSFYGKKGVYANDFKNNGFSKPEIKTVVEQYLNEVKEDQWGGGDSLDRESVRAILELKN